MFSMKKGKDVNVQKIKSRYVEKYAKSLSLMVEKYA